MSDIKNVLWSVGAQVEGLEITNKMLKRHLAALRDAAAVFLGEVGMEEPRLTQLRSAEALVAALQEAEGCDVD